MSDTYLLNEKFNSLKVCVIIPTYNNGSTLAKIIRDVAGYTHHIILVNDGSTDNTLQIVKEFPFINLVTYEKNVGKGWALRKAFKQATVLGYDYAITIDSDGQHFATDLPSFINKLETERNAIIVGSRNMDQASVPGKSSFGHKFSNFWFKVETGKECPDTQSGFRLYPLHLLKDMKFITQKYEFEIEVIVLASWRGITVDSVPVTVHYEPKETRVSHFRPFQDFSRVSVLNTFLVIIAFAYIKPRDFFRSLFDKKKSKRELLAQLFSPDQPDHTKAISVGVGVCCGILPIWGFQMLAAIALAVIFKLNKALAIIFSHISIAPMIPVVVFLSYKAGSYWMGSESAEMIFDIHLSIKSITEHLEQYIYGSITLAIVAGLAAALLTFTLLRVFKRKPVSAF